MGKFRLRVLLALVGFACALSWSGCSSNSTLAITLTPASTSTITINQGQTQAITAAVANDPSNEGVTWSLSGGGTLISPTTTSVIYEAPASLPTNTTVSVTATSVANTGITAVLSITVNAVLTITTPSLPVGALGVPYSTVINAGGSTGPFIWALKTGSLPPGLTLSQSVSDSVVISGTPTALGTTSFTVQVTDSTGTVASQALSITINKPPPLSVATRSLSTGTVGVSYNQTLRPASGVPPYTWEITTGGGGCVGTACLPAGLSLTGAVISGIPTTAGTSSFTVQVMDSTVPTPQTATAGLSITINPSAANDANIQGNYAFLLSGFSSNGHFVAAGSFIADGAGNITGGVIDTNDPDPTGPKLGQAFTGTYAIGSNNLGTMALGARSFAVSVMGNGNAKMIEFDQTGTQCSGVLLKQSTSDFLLAQIKGNYAFGFSGTDAVAARSALAGAMIADGAGHFTSGLLDENDAGVAQNVAFTGTYTGINSATGRGTATINIAGQGTTNYSFYIVSTTQLLMMEIDFVSGQVSPIVSGSILQQPVSLGPSLLSGTGVLQTSAISGGTAQSQVGLFVGDGVVNFSVNTDENTNGVLSSPSCTGTFSVDSSSGRVALTYPGTACAENVLYLAGTNQAFAMGTDANVTSGFMEAQSGVPFSAASLSGTYAGGSLAAVLSGAPTQVDIALADGLGDLDFTTDISSNSGGLVQNQNTSGNYSLASTGRGTITPTNGGHAETFYMVSTAEFISLITDTDDATLEDFEK